MYVLWYTYVYGCGLTIRMYFRTCIYVYVHIGAQTYFMREPLILPEYKLKWFDVSGAMTKKGVSIPLVHLIGYSGDISGNILYPVSRRAIIRKSGIFTISYL